MAGSFWSGVSESPPNRTALVKDDTSKVARGRHDRFHRRGPMGVADVIILCCIPCHHAGGRSANSPGRR
jgi:hypothetical protein